MSGFQQLLVDAFHLDVDGNSKAADTLRSTEMDASVHHGLVGHFLLALSFSDELERTKEAAYR